MEGTPPVAHHLLHYAKTLADCAHHRLAALAFAAAADARGTNPRVQARVLYNAAHQLYLVLSTSAEQHTESRQEDATRAVQFLRKCAVLLRSQSDASELRMSTSALLEKIYTNIGDHHAAGKAVRAGLDDVNRVIGMERSLVVHWWTYFQCRAVANALAKRDPVRSVIQMAQVTAVQCAKHGDVASAVAFCLTNAQIALSNTTPDCVDISQTLTRARENLAALSRNVTPANRADFLHLTFCYYILQGLQYMRRGDLRGAHERVVKGLRKSYDRLRRLQQDSDSKNGLWRWMPSQVMTAITCHIIISTNPNEEERRRHTYALTSLLKLGLDHNAIQNFSASSLRIADLPPRVSSTLAAAFFETAARIRMTAVDLKSAAPLITAAINAIFDDRASRVEIRRIEAGEEANIDRILPRGLPVSQVLARCAVMLLASEYYYLRGVISAALVSQKFLEVALVPAGRFKNHDGSPLVSDGWQIAASLHSLLTGKERQGTGTFMVSVPNDHRLIESDDRNGFGMGFANQRVLGMAWLTIGVFQSRKNEVLESRKALENALNSLVDIAGQNDQVVANASSLMSGLFLNHERIGNVAPEMINNAITIAEAMDDTITLSRALRIYKKWVGRASHDFNDVTVASERSAQAYELLRRKQAGACNRLFADPR